MWPKHTEFHVSNANSRGKSIILFHQPTWPAYLAELSQASRMNAGQSARAKSTSDRGEGPARHKRKALPTSYGWMKLRIVVFVAYKKW